MLHLLTPCSNNVDMPAKWTIDMAFLEHGDIYFFYKPKRGIDQVQDILDVSRFYFVLQPDGDSPPRYIVMGNKRLPGATDGGNSTWGFVQIVGGRGFAASPLKTKPVKGASRPAGEGIYALVSHRGHTHLLYSLELPKMQGPVQQAFGIASESNYIFLQRPVETSPESPEQPFSNFTPAVPVGLNHRGTEILLVGVGSDIGRLGIKVEKDRETIHSADVFSRLHLDPSRHPPASLISGNWA